MMRKQKGVAMIMFVMIAPVLLGILFLSVQGAIMMQNKVRIEDAVDMANMAVISQKSSDPKVAKKLAEQYVRAYMTGENDNIIIKIEKLGCYDSVKCRKDSDNGKPIYTESKLSAVTNHDYWFSNPFSSEPNYDVTASSLSRLYQGTPADIYFIADMSGTMGHVFLGASSGQSKFETLAAVIKRVTRDLEFYNSHHDYRHRVAFIGYNYFTHSLTADGNVFEVEQFNLRDTNVRSTIANMLKIKPYRRQVVLDSSSRPEANFYDMLLTDNFSSFNEQIALFSPKSGTASGQGIIRAAQIADRAVDLNENQVFIILSDGVDVFPRTTLDLVQAGMCRNIMSLFKHKKAFNGEEIRVKLAVIGIDYNVKSFPAMARCVGAENVYQASSGDDVYKNIINLISEESGRLVTN